MLWQSLGYCKVWCLRSTAWDYSKPKNIVVFCGLLLKKLQTEGHTALEAALASEKLQLENQSSSNTNNLLNKAVQKMSVLSSGKANWYLGLWSFHCKACCIFCFVRTAFPVKACFDRHILTILVKHLITQGGGWNGGKTLTNVLFVSWSIWKPMADIPDIQSVVTGIMQVLTFISLVL